MLPLVSIVIVAYNVEKHIEKAIESVVNQTYKEIEIIIVDDCSIDHTLEVINKFKDNDTRIKSIGFLANKGCLQARKAGVAIAKGQYIMFLDADDTLELDACERALNIIIEKKVDVVEFGRFIYDCSEQGISQWLRDFFDPPQGYLYGDDIINESFAKQNLVWNVTGKLFNMDICKKAYMEIEDEQISRYEDFYIFFIIAYYSNSYYGIEDKLYNYYFGRGMCGNNVNVVDYTRYCRDYASLGCIIRKLKGFNHRNNAADEFNTILETYEDNFANEALDAVLKVKSDKEKLMCIYAFFKEFSDSVKCKKILGLLNDKKELICYTYNLETVCEEVKKKDEKLKELISYMHNLEIACEEEKMNKEKLIVENGKLKENIKLIHSTKGYRLLEFLRRIRNSIL